MTQPDARPDLVDALIRSCWLVEGGRARVFAAWGGEYADEGERTARRAEMIRRILSDRAAAVPEDVLDAHTEWVASLVGPRPDSVPLGAAVLQRFADWTNIYMTPYLGEGAEEFRKLGEGELRFPVPPRHATEDEIVLASPELPPGRRFVILTDIHIGAEGTGTNAEVAVRDVNVVAPEFVIVPGDITEDGEPEQYVRAAEILAGLDAPVHAVLGNHDRVQRSTREPVGRELFATAFGREPADTVVEIGALQVALIDSTDPVPSPFPDWDLARGGFREDSGGVNNGALEPGQARALAERLDPERPTLLVLHHELQPFPAFPPVMFGLRDADSAELLEALAAHRLVGVVAGHTHRSALLGVGDGSVPQLEVPSLKDWPYTYTVVGVEDDRVQVTWRQISDREFVWKRGEHVPPIYLNYVTGPLSRVTHTFEL